MPNFIALGQSVYQKSVTKFLYSFSILAPNLGSGVQQTPILKIRLHLLPNFVDFGDGVKHTKTQKVVKTVNDIVYALPCGNNK